MEQFFFWGGVGHGYVQYWAVHENKIFVNKVSKKGHILSKN